ncbi:hypothetical protein F8B43_5358 [Methylorubrum populi]|uniref:Uncharacterized protein n=1 Tax=Methylorubrum populi TaxID=223967 RepID=A0A833J113_9HYPH|nr:hypothetical protein F8B43_5358 [Methylorubrum populi]
MRNSFRWKYADFAICDVSIEQRSRNSQKSTRKNCFQNA